MEYSNVIEKEGEINTLSPLARLMARRGLKTLSTRRIFTTDIAPELQNKFEWFKHIYL